MPISFSPFALIPLLLFSSQFPAAVASCLDDAPYPDWAHAHWIWQSGGDLSQQGMFTPARCRWARMICPPSGTLDLLGNYTLRGIPVGAVNIDSQWQVTARSLSGLAIS